METNTGLAKRVSNSVKAYSGILQRSSLFVKIILIAGGSLVSGISQFFQFDKSGNFSAANLSGIAGSLVVFIGVIFVMITEQDASKSLALAQEAVVNADEIKADYIEIERIFSDFLRYIEIYQCMNVMCGALESGFAKRLDEIEICTLLMNTAHRSLRISMNFQTQDQGTICIFRAERQKDGQHILRCVAHWREVDCEIRNARTWENGVGIAGSCYANKSEVIVADMRADGVKSIVGGPSAPSKTYDFDRYRSMAAVPIMIKNAPEICWGVVVATNSNANHFSYDQESGLKAEEAVRALANMVALGVTVANGYRPQTRAT